MDAAQIALCVDYIPGGFLNQHRPETSKADALSTGLVQTSAPTMMSLLFHYRFQAAQAIIEILTHLLVDVDGQQK